MIELIEDKSEKKALSPAQYWEWRTTISEMQTAQAQHKISELELKLMQKDAEIQIARIQLFQKLKVEQSQKSFEAAQAEYKRFKEVLEKDLDVSLNDKIIDEVTFEIKDVPKENNNKKTP